MADLIGARTKPAPAAKDATIETFEADVLKASMNGPVIVDFWAAWCGPCKTLAPALEKAVAATKGAVTLVKVDIDRNKMLAQQMRIQSIPTVYAFYKGRPVDGFQGAIPESEVKAFVARLSQFVGPDGAGDEADLDAFLDAANGAFESGDVAGAAEMFSQIAEADPANIKAIVGLARCALALGDVEQAKGMLNAVPEAKRSDPAFAAVTASIALAESSPPAGDLAALEKNAAREPANLSARFDLAAALLGAGDTERALDELLAIIERDRAWNEEAARKKLLTVFDALGPAHPATIRGRRRLSSILFS
jgi:putative thioredoxin